MDKSSSTQSLQQRNKNTVYTVIAIQVFFFIYTFMGYEIMVTFLLTVG